MDIIVVVPLILGAFTFAVLSEKDYSRTCNNDKIFLWESWVRDELLEKLIRTKSVVP